MSTTCGPTYAPGTALVTLEWDDPDVVFTQQAAAVTLPVANLYPMGGTPRRARTIARAREWAEFAGFATPDRVTLHAAD